MQLSLGWCNFWGEMVRMRGAECDKAGAGFGARPALLTSLELSGFGAWVRTSERTGSG
jgi:hypothetical protein